MNAHARRGGIVGDGGGGDGNGSVDTRRFGHDSLHRTSCVFSAGGKRVASSPSAEQLEDKGEEVEEEDKQEDKREVVGYIHSPHHGPCSSTWPRFWWV